MTNKKRARSSHQNTKTLEEAVASFMADIEARLDEMENTTGQKSWYTLKDVQTPLSKLRAAYEAHTGKPSDVPRQPYERKVERNGRDSEIEERHESYGLVHISRVTGHRRLFGSSVQHQHFFSLRVLRGRRVMKTYGEHYWDDHRVPIVEIALSPAQFVEMITSQNLGSGVPCTIMSVDGVPMDPTPDDAGSEIKVIAEMFEDSLVEMVDKLREHDKNLGKILEKKTFNKEDKERIHGIVHAVRRLIDDNAPFVLKMMGEHTEKLMAKGKMEIDAFIQLALTRAGIKAIRDNGGELLLGEGDGQGQD